VIHALAVPCPPAPPGPLLDTYGIAQQPCETVYLSALDSGDSPRERKRIARALRAVDPEGRFGAHRAALDRRAHRLEDCGRYVVTYADAAANVRVTPNNCDDPLCNRCAWHRSRKIRLRFHAAAAIERAHNRRVRMLTLTQVTRSGESWAQAHARFMKGWRSFWRDPQTRKKIKGGLRRIETTWSHKSRAWHVHAHLAYAGSFWKTEDLSKVWSSHADGKIVDAREVYKDAELFKYLVKTAKTSASNLQEYAVQSHRRRLLDLVGTWRDIKAPEPEETENKLFEVEPGMLRRAAEDPALSRWVLSSYASRLEGKTPAQTSKWAELVLAKRDHLIRELAGREVTRVHKEHKRAIARLARSRVQALA
jgi:hypothetical protein